MQALVGMTPQARGRRFNAWIAELLGIHGVAARADNRSLGEIDVAFSVGDTRYVLEAKWTTAKADTGQLAKLQKRVRQRLAGTCGVFVSCRDTRPRRSLIWRTASALRCFCWMATTERRCSSVGSIQRISCRGCGMRPHSRAGLHAHDGDHLAQGAHGAPGGPLENRHSHTAGHSEHGSAKHGLVEYRPRVQSQSPGGYAAFVGYHGMYWTG
jgi:hypothetical protein